MTRLIDSLLPADDVEPLLSHSCGEALRRAAAEVPDREALVDGQGDPALRRSWTYRELLADSERAARALLGRFEPGDHVAVWSPNRPEWVVLQFGLALAGMTIVTVNPAYRREELRYVLEQSRSAGVFHQDEYRGESMAEAVASLRDELPSLRESFDLAKFDEFLATGEETTPLPEVDPHAPCMIQYTSGTTGFPKGAHLHHHGLTNNARLTALRRGAEGGTIDISAMPLFHTGGCVAGVLGTIQTRGTYVLVPEFQPQLFLDLIERERAQHTLCVPTMLIALLEAQRARPRDLSSLESVLSGGATVPVELVKRVESEMDVAFSIIFGQTETSPVITMVKLDDSDRDKSETLGTALPHTEVKIVDPEDGKTLPVGESGELCTRGYLVMHGYFDMPEATAKTIDPEGWLHTGDLCSMDERGYCRVEGRLKDMIIRGGENIYPREIEELLFEHDAISEVAIVGIPDDRWGEQPAAFVRFAEGQRASASTLEAYVRSRLAPHKTPRTWIGVESFPQTPSGKIQKFKLRDRFVAGELVPNLG